MSERPLDDPLAMEEDVENNPEAYADVSGLGFRGSSAVQLKKDGGETDQELYRKYGFSMAQAQLAGMTKKLGGYLRDAHVTDNLERQSILGSTALFDLFLNAPCVNRQGRYDYEDERARHWKRLMDRAAKEKGDETIGSVVEKMMDRWSEAHSFCQLARIQEEKFGIDATRHLDAQFVVMRAQQQEVELESAQLPMAANMFYSCRVLQVKIMRERIYDLAMDFPTADYTVVRKFLADGGDVNDMVMEMPWPFRDAYGLVQGSMMDGVEHRTQMAAMNAQQIPQQWGSGPNPYGMMPMMGQQMPPDGQQQGEDGQQPDKRKSFFNFGGGQQGGQQQQPEPQKRRRKRSASAKGG